MKNLKRFIKESLNDMLTFKGGHELDSNSYSSVSDEDKVKALETITCKKLFLKKEPGSLSYEYYYESSKYPEGILVMCSKSDKKYLVTHHGHIIDFSR